MASYKTLSSPARFEIDKIKGSRFIGFSSPVATEQEALDVIEAIRREFHDARHYCYAWRLGGGPDRYRHNDDGEPRGTGGPPILRQIDGRELIDVVVCVVRYFGGTKLGTGGLTKAYSAGASAVLDISDVLEIQLTSEVHLTFEYGLSGQIKAVANAHELKPAREAFGAEVEQWFKVPIEGADAFVADLINRTASRISIDVTEP